MRILFVLAAGLQVAAVLYCAALLRTYWKSATAWMWLLAALLSMLLWRVVMTTGVTPSPLFNISIAIWGSVSAVLAMFFFGREMASRERAEAERDRLLTSERAARTDAERASRIKDDFMATLSHELRSPLAAMLGWCAIAKRGHLPADVERAINTIERNARMQARLVDDLLDATRMQAGSLHLDLLPVSLDGPVRSAVEGVRPAAEAKQLTLRFECAERVPVVIGDGSRLQQIASNLLVNAVKFTPSGKTVTVSVRSVGDHAELTVSDEGIGIEQAFMPHLFERFRQADSGTARRHGGLGLGLSIVWSLVALHQGEVHATSNGPGTGATFVVRLPLSKRLLEAPPLDEEGGTSTNDSQTSLGGMRVIVVDDEADVRDAVAGLLKRAGADVLALDSGASIELAVAEYRPDVLVLDIGMPGEDGYTLIQRIRRLPVAEGGAVPAISLTAHARDEDRQHALGLGFQAHLAKPVNVALLLMTLRRLVPRREPADAGVRPHAQGASTAP